MKPNYSGRIEEEDKVIAQIFEEGNVLGHITEGHKKPVARCFDRRNEEFRVEVTVDLFTFYPIDFGEEQDDAVLPDFRFVIEAMEACSDHATELWNAWDELRFSSQNWDEE